MFEFTNEYGFADKRLPVLRVAGPDGPVFVDLIDGVVAAQPTGALARAEARSFDTIHKWTQSARTANSRHAHDGGSGSDRRNGCNGHLVVAKRSSRSSESC